MDCVSKDLQLRIISYHETAIKLDAYYNQTASAANLLDLPIAILFDRAGISRSTEYRARTGTGLSEAIARKVMVAAANIEAERKAA